MVVVSAFQYILMSGRHCRTGGAAHFLAVGSVSSIKDFAFKLCGIAGVVLYARECRRSMARLWGVIELKNRVELRNFIRYQLAQLGERNGEHEFELLSFELARARHVSNLQPATGPVKAGGDQGRDFESYHTYLKDSPIGRTTFSVLLSHDIVVGACTLNKKIAPKIKADLQTIFGAGDKPDRVIYYCEPSVPVAKRHGLQAYCQDTYNSRLDIFDGLAIADMLSDADTFWIAEQYLQVPANFFPEGEVDEEYDRLRERWLTTPREPTNYADFLSIKSGLRTATTEDAAKPDFSAWLAKIGQFLGEAYSPLIRHRARYEIVAAESKRGTIEQAGEHLSTYFDEVADFTNHASDLQDASVLVSFSFYALREKQTTTPFEQIASWRDKVAGLLEVGLSASTKKVEQLTLMEAQATIKSFDFEKPLSEKQDALVKAWLAIAKLARTVPYYPLPHLDKVVKLLSDFAGSVPDFAALRDECDEIARERAGARTVSEKAFARAGDHYKAGRILAAVDELHRAKVGAFTGEEIPQAVLLMLMLSECYTELKLHFAARYYAAGAVYMTYNACEEAVYSMLPQATFALARAHYLAGEGASALLLSKTAMFAQAHMADNPGDTAQHEDMQSTLADIAATYTLCRRFVPGLIPALDDSLNKWPFERSVLDQYLEVASKSESPWASMPLSEVVDRSESELGVLPFRDLGPRRTVCWMALGIEWTVEFDSQRKLLPAIHGLLAALQVVQGEFASVDLNIIPTKVLIKVDTAPVPLMNVQTEPDNEILKWHVTVPTDRPDHASLDDAILDGLSVAVTIIGQATALDIDAFAARIDELFKRGLKARVFSVRPTEELMDFVLAQMDGEEALTSIACPVKNRVVTPMESKELAWRSGPGPGYTKEKANQILVNRYRVGADAIRLSLPKIIGDPRGQAWIAKSREAGHLDWCTLGLLANLVCRNQTERRLGRPLRPEDVALYTARMLRSEEEADGEFDLGELTDENFEAQSRASLMAVANTWKLMSHLGTPVFDGFRRLLDERYGFSSDDIPHEDPFAGATV